MEDAYSLPAGIFSNVALSFKPEKPEKNIGKILKHSSKTVGESVTVQKKLKSQSMGAAFVSRLLSAGQDPALKKILSFLTWLDFATLLVILGPADPKLALLAVGLTKNIFVDHTKKDLEIFNEGEKQKTTFLKNFFLECKLKRIFCFLNRMGVRNQIERSEFDVRKQIGRLV